MNKTVFRQEPDGFSAFRTGVKITFAYIRQTAAGFLLSYGRKQELFYTLALAKKAAKSIVLLNEYGVIPGEREGYTGGERTSMLSGVMCPQGRS